MKTISGLSHKNVTIPVLVFIVCLFLITCPVESGEGKDILLAGAAKIEITPEKPVKMAGYAARKALSDGVHDPLSARVIVFENNAKRLVLVSTDLLGFYNETAEPLRKAILEDCKIDPSELFLCAIHTHAGPTLTIDKKKGHPNNLKYTEGLKAKLVEVVRKAFKNLGEVRTGIGVGYSPVGANRRELKINNAGESSIQLGRNPYGPTDKEVLVMKVAKPDDTVVAALFDYATHATCLGGRNLKISGDVLGLAEQFVEKILGKGVISPAFAGASGNIDPWFRVLPSFNTEPGWIPEPVLLGTLLGEEVVHVFRDISKVSAGGEIETSFTTLQLPGNSRGEVGVTKDSPPAELNITTARIGDIAFVGIGCEVLTEIGMVIKAASPYKHTFVITHCNGAAGYLVPKDLYIEEGYEVRSSPFAPQAADMVVKEAVRMLHGL